MEVRRNAIEMRYQEINEGLAKGKYEKSIKQAIQEADQYLIHQNGKCPEWLTSFFDSNREKMTETICRATRAGGIASLNGYREGYFNEIIQNANDLRYPEYIEVNTSIDDSIYTVECIYKDKGFSISNVYGFLNREMSDKSEVNQQTGKYGIGIKSFFQFVDHLSIESNVNIQFDIKRTIDESGELNTEIVGSVLENYKWDKQHTKLKFTFDANLESPFNTKKLVDFIDYLAGENDDYDEQDVIKSLATGKSDELIFDLRSMIFMGLNRSSENKSEPDSRARIREIQFIGDCHEVLLSCSYVDEVELSIEERNWNLIKTHLELVIDDTSTYEWDYLVFRQGKMSFAYAIVEEDRDENNRYYSTYFLKESGNELTKSGLLIDTSYSNMHRTDLGDNLEDIEVAKKAIIERLSIVYLVMTSPEAGKSSLAQEISDIFHWLLYQYRDIDTNEHMDSPLRIEVLTNQYLPKTQMGTVIPYVVRSQEKEPYMTYAYEEGNISKEIAEVYHCFVEREETIDYSTLIDDEEVIAGVMNLYWAIMQDQCSNQQRLLSILNLFPSVKNFIAFRISGEKPFSNKVSDAAIDRWLIKCKQEKPEYYKENYLLKLIGRYSLNTAIAYNGDICEGNLSFKNYIFNDYLSCNGGVLSQMQTKAFEQKYGGLKQELLNKRFIDCDNKNNEYLIRCMRPYGKSLRWNSDWYRRFDFYNCSNHRVDTSKFRNALLLLERVANDNDLINSMLYDFNNRILLFEQEARELLRREQLFEYYTTIEQQIIDVSAIKNIQTYRYDDFFDALEQISNIKNDKIKNSIHLKCTVDSMNTKTVIEGLLPRLISVCNMEAMIIEGYDVKDFEIRKLQEDVRNEYPEQNALFIQKLTGYRIHLYRFDSKGKKNIVAYAFQNKFEISLDNKSVFKPLAKYDGNNQDIYIFYDNYNNNHMKAVSDVLSKLDINPQKLELLSSYIYNGNTTKTLNYTAYMRNLAKTKRKLILEWSDIRDGEIGNITDNEVLYRILTARGCYDIFCPICADVPIETIDFDDKNKKKHSRRLLILENENKDTRKEIPYIITVCCRTCFEKLENTLSSSELKGNKLVISTQLAHGQHEKLVNRQEIELSPVNIELMRSFKLC